MKVLICGSRYWRDKTRILQEVEVLMQENNNDVVIVAGGAAGADTLAEEVAKENLIELRKYSPDWRKYGPSAGLLRNIQMLDSEKPDLVLAFCLTSQENRGTLHCVSEAVKRNINVKVVWQEH